MEQFERTKDWGLMMLQSPAPEANNWHISRRASRKTRRKAALIQMPTAGQ